MGEQFPLLVYEFRREAVKVRLDLLEPDRSKFDVAIIKLSSLTDSDVSTVEADGNYSGRARAFGMRLTK